MNEQVNNTCLGTRGRSLSNLCCRGQYCLEDEIDKVRELLQEVGTGLYTVVPCAQTRCAQTMLTNIWNKRKQCVRKKRTKRGKY